MIKLVYRDDIKQGEKIKYYYFTHADPLCHIAGCSVYLCTKLTKATVQVFGEFEWK